MATDLCIPTLKKQYEAGMSVAQIAAAHGVVPETIRRRLVLSGVTMRPRGGNNNPTGKNGRWYW